ncbi:RepA protein, IncFII-like family protein [Providencia alcalifaciens F90-2004]|uniref:RepA family replication protein n=1 Tax=Providencia alcalifaciens TaxID=126385 RepID=UPI000450E9CD|nr:RepA family replication protein [Providencia alcalifaciens]ETT05694.1 RepA protein, IncFII-like family protein [Providencia alcalifaciens F90-2004]
MNNATSNATIRCSVGKIHRHCEPKFLGQLPKLVPVRRFAAALKRHDWNRNPHIYELRCARQQRISVRSERRETYDVLALAMIAYADYNPESDALFEVMCSVEKLAELCGQLHRYDSGRKSYDPILHALRDWEQANLIIIDRDFDVEAKQYKAMRIWIRPEFFHGLGFSTQALRDVVTRFRRWMEKQGLKASYQKRYAQHVLRLARANVASLEDKHALRNLLNKLKTLVIGNDEALKQEKKHLTQALKEKKALARSAQSPESAERAAWRRFEAWRTTQPLASVMVFEREMRSLYPSVHGQAIYLCYLKHLPDA